jgi:hypothetical protein
MPVGSYGTLWEPSRAGWFSIFKEVFMAQQKPDFSLLAKKWPSSFVARQEVEKFTGGMVSVKYLANLDCQGLGPKGRIKVGRKIAYSVDSFVEWLESRACLIEG